MADRLNEEEVAAPAYGSLHHSVTYLNSGPPMRRVNPEPSALTT